MAVPVNKFANVILPWQKQVFEAFDAKEPYKRFFVAECHRRSRKTSLILNMFIREACRRPKSVYPYVGPTYTQAKKDVWLDPNMLFTYLPDKRDFGWEKNESELYIRFENGSLILILGADKPDSLRGLDAQGVGFDEYSLMKEATYTAIFRPILTQDIKRWAIFAYTPQPQAVHAFRLFDEAAMIGTGGILPTNGPAEKMKDEWFAIRIVASQSGILTKEELAKARKDIPESLYLQEYECARLTEEQRTLITSMMLSDLTGINWEYARRVFSRIKRIVSIDPGFTGDFCTIMGIENNRIVSGTHRKFHTNRTPDIVLEGKKVAAEIATKNFIVDTIGWGKGVYDSLASDAAGYNVIPFNSAESPSQDHLDGVMFANCRAEAYYYTAERIKALEVEAISTTSSESNLIIELPVASRYTANRSGKLIIIPKDEIKAILGHSPDDSDTFVMGIYGLQFVRSETDENIAYLTQEIGGDDSLVMSYAMRTRL